jgi:hypothetical protein
MSETSPVCAQFALSRLQERAGVRAPWFDIAFLSSRDARSAREPLIPIIPTLLPQKGKG